MIKRIDQELATYSGLQNVEVFACSHVGGHKFAGNVLVYPEGDWYGNITADRVGELVQTHFAANSILREFWRGRSGLSPEEQKLLL